MPSFFADGPCPLQLLLHPFHDMAFVEQRQHRDETFLVERRKRLPVRHFEEEVEVIGHQIVSHNPHPGEGFLVAEDLAEDLLVLRFKDHPPAHDAGHDVVEGSSSSEEARGSHVER